MIKVGDIVKLRSGMAPTSDFQTGIVVEVDRNPRGGFAHVSWTWAEGRVGRNFVHDLVKVRAA
jgi:hypothetical protein